jgi:peptidyl-prolyl cis-trans isomerase C
MDSSPDGISVNGVAVDPADLPSPAVAAVRELLRQRAAALGLLASFSEDEAVTRAIEQLLDREVAIPSATEEEYRRYYDAHRDSFRSGDLVFARHILFQITPGSPLDLVRAKAEQTLAQVAANPKTFEESARSLSNCPSGQHGGNLGQIGRGDTVPEFEQALFADGWIGILPRLVKTRYGFHIVSVDRRAEGIILPFEAVRQRISNALTARVQETALRQYVRLLAGQADVRGVDLDPATTPLVQ